MYNQYSIRAMSSSGRDGLPTTTTTGKEGMRDITPCLWFDTEGEEAATSYTSVFPNSKILEVARYGEAGPRPAGTVMTVSFELDGQKFLALNGGPEFTFSEAISFQVDCETPGGGRRVLEQALRGRGGGAVRLAQGPLRRLVADRPDPAARSSWAIPTREKAQRAMKCDARHEEDRDRRARARRRGGVASERGPR